MVVIHFCTKIAQAGQYICVIEVYKVRAREVCPCVGHYTSAYEVDLIRQQFYSKLLSKALVPTSTQQHTLRRLMCRASTVCWLYIVGCCGRVLIFTI